MTDFVGGVKSANDYLNRTVSVPTAVDVTPDGVIVRKETSYSMREIICALLAGNGLKLPNIQICLKININRLIPEIPAALAELQNALNEANAALDEFIAHTDIENVLGRLNAAVAEFSAVANMINFCGTPIVPRAIPNVLKDMLGAFTGKGQALLDSLGKMTDIGGCIGTDGKFNPAIFDQYGNSILGEIAANYDNLLAVPESVWRKWTSDLHKFSADMRELIEFENNFGGGSTSSKGGSTFAPVTRVNTGVGVSIDVENMSLQNAQRISSNLQSAYNSLKAYEVDGQGNNIFHYILEPEMIARLENETPPEPVVSTRVPIYDYCGKVIGYTDVPVSGDTSPKSAGAAAVIPDQPGLSGIPESGVVVSAPPASSPVLGKTNIVATAAPETAKGAVGDKAGDLASDGAYLYYCTTSYTDGVADIWLRSALSTW